uniref:Uncharacterized protein n=2 Tax=Avena sativa TaxID=4498 RepID=A0ACD6A9K8_AVESA
MSRLDLNIDLDDIARRLSFSPASPRQLPPRPPRPNRPCRFVLSPIQEDPLEQQAAVATQAPVHPPPWASSPFPAPHTATYDSPPTSYPPVSPSPSPVRTETVPVSPAPSGFPSETQQQVAAALGKLEQKRQAGLQQAWMAAQEQQALALAFGGWDQRRQAGPQHSWALAQPQQAVAAAASALKELEQGRTSGSLQAWAEAQPHPEPPPPQQLRLYTVEGEPAGYTTKWEELHPVSQQLLLQIEDKIREERHACEQLDQCSRLCDLSVSNNSFEFDARQIAQEIGLISTIMGKEKASIKSLMDAVREIMSNAEFAIGSYVKMRPWFVSIDGGIANTGLANPARSSDTPTEFSYNGPVRRPSIFMQHTVYRFEKQVEECCKLIGELEQLVQMNNNKTYPPSLEPLPKVMSNMHDYFIYVASKVENLHQCAEMIRTQYLNDLRNSGNRNDPFVEADRKEAAKQEAAARTVHPTLPKRMVTP